VPYAKLIIIFGQWGMCANTVPCTLSVDIIVTLLLWDTTSFIKKYRYIPTIGFRK